MLLTMPKAALWSPVGRAHSCWDSDTRRALSVMARLGHPQHLLLPLLMLCVSVAVSWEDKDTSHTSCLPPYVCYLEDESPFMTLSYFPLSQAAYQFQQLEKVILPFKQEDMVWRETEANKPH